MFPGPNLNIWGCLHNLGLNSKFEYLETIIVLKNSQPRGGGSGIFYILSHLFCSQHGGGEGGRVRPSWGNSLSMQVFFEVFPYGCHHWSQENHLFFKLFLTFPNFPQLFTTFLSFSIFAHLFPTFTYFFKIFVHHFQTFWNFSNI